MSTVVDLPSSGTPDLTYFIVDYENNLVMGVDAVKPGGTIEFVDAGVASSELDLAFKNNTSPFNANETIETNQTETLSSSSSGDYYFGFEAESPNPQTYPYRIEVESGGADSATFHLNHGGATTALNVAQSYTLSSGQTKIKVKFQKEGFTGDAYIQVSGDGSGILRVPDGQTVGIWTITLNPAPTTTQKLTLAVSETEPVLLEHNIQVEVFGGSEADFEIEPAV